MKPLENKLDSMDYLDRCHYAKPDHFTVLIRLRVR
jgi:hypothetical protein